MGGVEIELSSAKLGNVGKQPNFTPTSQKAGALWRRLAHLLFLQTRSSTQGEKGTILKDTASAHKMVLAATFGSMVYILCYCRHCHWMNKSW